MHVNEIHVQTNEQTNKQTLSSLAATHMYMGVRPSAGAEVASERHEVLLPRNHQLLITLQPARVGHQDCHTWCYLVLCTRLQGL